MVLCFEEIWKITNSSWSSATQWNYNSRCWPTTNFGWIYWTFCRTTMLHSIWSFLGIWCSKSPSCKPRPHSIPFSTRPYYDSPHYLRDSPIHLLNFNDACYLSYRMKSLMWHIYSLMIFPSKVLKVNIWILQGNQRHTPVTQELGDLFGNMQ